MASELSRRRLFVGTFLSAEQQELLGRLKGASERLAADWGMRLRWVKPVKLHMTWIFLGSTEAGLIPDISGRLAAMVSEHGPMETSYDRVEFWPSARKPRQLVMIPSVVPEALRGLSDRIRTELAEFCEKPEDRPFRPHLTLLRFDHHDQSGRGKRPENRRLDLPHWFDPADFLPLVHEIRQVSLIESHMGKGNDDYEVLEDFRLTARS